VVKLNSTTLDELQIELKEKHLEIARESCISTLIGLDTGVESVLLDIEMTDELKSVINMELQIVTSDYEKIFDLNQNALVELEEFELLTEIQQHMTWRAISSEYKPNKKE
jgi:hypothetical protein